MTRIVIVGAGQAGARAAIQLRKQQFDGSIVLIGDEPHLPYERPPLSKNVLLGTSNALDGVLCPLEYYKKEDIQLIIASRVQQIDRQEKCVAVTGSSTYSYDKLILATGAKVRTVSIPGSDTSDIHYIRDITDADRLRTAMLAGASSLLVIGAGFIGLEVAASARAIGLEVVVIERASGCLTRVFPHASANIVADLHEQNGAELIFDVDVIRISTDGCLRRIELSDGRILDVDLIVAGVGSVPNSEIARAAGLECDNGVLTDESGRTSDPDIYAIGDVSEFRSKWTGGHSHRFESWENAERQAARVADLLTGCDSVSDNTPPWFWTDQYDWNIQLVGMPSAEDDMYVRPGKTERQFSHLYVRQNQLVAAVLFNNGRERRQTTRLISDAIDINTAVLTDPDTNLRNIA